MPAAIADLKARYDATVALFEAQLSTRVISKALKHFTDQTDADLTTGIVMIVTAGERDFKNQKGMIAKEGTQRMLLVGHLRVAETASPEDVQTAEFALIKEVKAALNTGVVGIGYSLVSVEQSRQLDFPYGWVVADLDAGPPRESNF